MRRRFGRESIGLRGSPNRAHSVARVCACACAWLTGVPLQLHGGSPVRVAALAAPVGMTRDLTPLLGDRRPTTDAAHIDGSTYALFRYSLLY